jgi:hypothetical protein
MQKTKTKKQTQFPPLLSEAKSRFIGKKTNPIRLPNSQAPKPILQNKPNRKPNAYNPGKIRHD